MDTCRLCAEETVDSTSIFQQRHDYSLAEMVHFVTSVKVTEYDELPTLVCNDCVRRTVDAFLYVNRVRETERLLKKSLSTETLPPKFVMIDVKEEAEQLKCTEYTETVASRVDLSGVEIIPTGSAENSVKMEELQILDIGDASVQYPGEESQSVSKEYIGLLIESVHDSGSQKWVKMEQDPDYTKERPEEHDESEQFMEEDSSDDGSSTYAEPKHINYTPQIDYEEQIVRCCKPNCKMVFKTRDELVQHGSEVHSVHRSAINATGQFECIICYQRFKNRKNLLCHLRRLIRDYHCQICNIYFDAPRDTRSHMKYYHKDATRTINRTSYRLEDQPIKICCGCEATFETVEDLYQHGKDQHQNRESSVSNNGEHQCNICYTHFKTKTILRYHQIIKYKSKTFSCSDCGKAFNRPSKLARHENTHRSDRKFDCFMCKETFQTRDDLRSHKTTQHERTLVCEECGSRFYRQGHLQSHMRSHDANTYEFSCNFCSKKFNRQFALSAHQKVHTKEKTFKCTYCSKMFGTPTLQRRHEVTHTGNYTHRCGVCGKGFIRPYLLQAHNRVCSKQEK